MKQKFGSVIYSVFMSCDRLFRFLKSDTPFLFFFILALLHRLVFQYLFLKGINLTSPAMGTAMPNIAPGLIFIIAWAFG